MGEGVGIGESWEQHNEGAIIRLVLECSRESGHGCHNGDMFFTRHLKVQALGVN